MAKKAGAKNDGAWQRFNNFITTAPPSQVAAITEAWFASEAIGDAFDTINNVLNQYGIPIPVEMASVTSWTSYWAEYGVPYDIWIGKVSYDIYEPYTNGQGKTYYRGLMGNDVRKAAVDVRYIARLAVFGDRQAAWLAYNGGKHHANPIPTNDFDLTTEAGRKARIEVMNTIREERREKKVPVLQARPKKTVKKQLTAKG